MNRRMVTLGTLVTAVTAATLGLGIMVQMAFTKSEVDSISHARKGSVSRVVILKGAVSVGHEENCYVLTDASGTAELYTCPSWYRKVNLRPGENVTVTGHVITRKPDDPQAKFVLAVHTIDRLSGEQIVLRTTTGKPPWASGISIRSSR